MRSAVAFLGSVFAVVACSSGGGQPCTLTAIGGACLNDSDCCTGWCELEGDGAYCQTKPKTPSQCVAAASFCTQDRNCCSGLCQNGQCFAGGAGTSCLEVGSPCAQADSCCTNVCMDDGQGHTWCASPPSGGGSCGLPGTACSSPGAPDPGECCFGLCALDGTCASGGGGGGGGNCGGAGAFCEYGTDCCSGTCEKVSSGSVCH